MVYPIQHHPVKWEVRCPECSNHATERFAYRDNAMRYARAIHDPIWSRLMRSEIEYAHQRGLPHISHDDCRGRARLIPGEHLYGDPGLNG